MKASATAMMGLKLVEVNISGELPLLTHGHLTAVKGERKVELLAYMPLVVAVELYAQLGVAIAELQEPVAHLLHRYYHGGGGDGDGPGFTRSGASIEHSLEAPPEGSRAPGRADEHGAKGPPAPPSGGALPGGPVESEGRRPTREGEEERRVVDEPDVVKYPWLARACSRPGCGAQSGEPCRFTGIEGTVYLARPNGELVSHCER